MDVTEAVMQLATALLAVVIPVVVAYVGYYAKRALEALEVKKYAEALREYDMALYARLMDAGKVAVELAHDRAEAFTESEIKPYLYAQAEEVSRSFSEKAGVRVDLSRERVDALIELAVREAEKAWKESSRPRPL
jgi:hypothetical protein